MDGVTGGEVDGGSFVEYVNNWVNVWYFHPHMISNNYRSVAQLIPDCANAVDEVIIGVSVEQNNGWMMKGMKNKALRELQSLVVRAEAELLYVWYI